MNSISKEEAYSLMDEALVTLSEVGEGISIIDIQNVANNLIIFKKWYVDNIVEPNLSVLDEAIYCLKAVQGEAWYYSMSLSSVLDKLLDFRDSVFED